MFKKYFFIFFILLYGTQIFAKPIKQYRSENQIVKSEKFESLLINRTDSVWSILDTKFDKDITTNNPFEITILNSGMFFEYYYYKLDDDNICLGISTFDKLHEDNVLYINTNKECGTKCKVFLDKSEDRQIFYQWEPYKEIISDETKERILIKTDKHNYSIYLKKGITELQLFLDGVSEVKSIKGLEKFPNLISITMNGLDVGNIISACYKDIK